ncbi:MAG: hypothetical protein ABIN94_21775 [Ferruginibacter sp.]
MKIFLPFFLFLLLSLVSSGQGLSVDNLFSMVSSSPAKCDNQLSGRGFSLKHKELQKDTLCRLYNYGMSKHLREQTDSIDRCISRKDTKDDCFVTYETASPTEFNEIITGLKMEGFHTSQPQQNSGLSGLLFQNKDLTVSTQIGEYDSINRYSLKFHKKIFPNRKDIYYANDLLAFTSHEYLTFFFGHDNVKEDLYYVEKDSTVKCSVLFFNTDRQVVFIWSDEVNRCGISSIMFGGQLNLKSSVASGKYVEQNNWCLKSGIRPGMSLEELRMRNGNDFHFYGGNSTYTGLVIPATGGKLNFKKEEIILGCLNCGDDKFATAKVINSDDSIVEGRVLFVLSVLLNPE